MKINEELHDSYHTFAHDGAGRSVREKKPTTICRQRIQRFSKDTKTMGNEELCVINIKGITSPHTQSNEGMFTRVKLNPPSISNALLYVQHTHIRYASPSSEDLHNPMPPNPVNAKRQYLVQKQTTSQTSSRSATL